VVQTTPVLQEAETGFRLEGRTIEAEQFVGIDFAWIEGAGPLLGGIFGKLRQLLRLDATLRQSASQVPVFGRPFFINSPSTANPFEIYDQYRQADPTAVDSIARSMFNNWQHGTHDSRPEAPDRTYWDSLQEAVPFSDHTTPPSFESIRIEITWKLQLLRDASDALARVRAVYDADGERYNPHQLMTEELPFILIEFAARLHPGWMTAGPLNPTRLMADAGIKPLTLFDSARLLFQPWGDQALNNPTEIQQSMITQPYQIGGYLTPDRVSQFIDLLDAKQNQLINARPADEQPQAQFAITMWREAAQYAMQKGFGLIEVADLFNAAEEVWN